MPDRFSTAAMLSSGIWRAKAETRSTTSASVTHRLWPALFFLTVQLGVIAALPVDDEIERIAHVNDDLCDEQPDDLLLRLGSRSGTVPCSSNVPAQRHQSFTIGQWLS